MNNEQGLIIGFKDYNCMIAVIKINNFWFNTRMYSDGLGYYVIINCKKYAIDNK